MGKIYKHKETGKLYELIQERILFKDLCYVQRIEYKWRGKKDEQFVLYKALYENTDGPYFVRHINNFMDSFEEVKDET